MLGTALDNALMQGLQQAGAQSSRKPWITFGKQIRRFA